MTESDHSDDPATGPAPRPETADARADLPAAARRALQEAEARRRAAAGADLPPELGGTDGPEPTRHGDWAHKGIATDF